MPLKAAPFPDASKTIGKLYYSWVEALYTTSRDEGKRAAMEPMFYGNRGLKFTYRTNASTLPVSLGGRDHTPEGGCGGGPTNDFSPWQPVDACHDQRYHGAEATE